MLNNKMHSFRILELDFHNTTDYIA